MAALAVSAIRSSLLFADSGFFAQANNIVAAATAPKMIGAQ